jgi:flagellin-specific chaperone FliS
MGKISESQIKSMIKTEIAQEMTSSLIAGLLAKIKTAKMRLENQDIKSAETLVLEALNIIVVHVKKNDI